MTVIVWLPYLSVGRGLDARYLCMIQYATGAQSNGCDWVGLLVTHSIRLPFRTSRAAGTSPGEACSSSLPNQTSLVLRQVDVQRWDPMTPEDSDVGGEPESTCEPSTFLLLHVRLVLIGGNMARR